MVVSSMSYLTTGSPGKEGGTNKPPPIGRIQEWSKEREDTSPYVLPTSQNPSHWNSSWLSNVCTTKKDTESDWLARDNPETNLITIKPKTTSHVAEQFSWVPLPCCSIPGHPFLVKSLALSACVSSDNSFSSVRQEPSLEFWKGSPFLKQNLSHEKVLFHLRDKGLDQMGSLAYCSKAKF